MNDGTDASHLPNKAKGGFFSKLLQKSQTEREREKGKEREREREREGKRNGNGIKT